MFIVSLTYLKPLPEIDRLLPAHVAYLGEQFARGIFVASGRKIPRTGGVILARAESREALLAALEQDPFHRHGVAEYEITEFVPSMTLPEYAGLNEA